MRIFLTAAGFLSAFVGVPWLTALCILALAVRYRAWEAIALGAFLDFMWLPQDVGLYTLPYFMIGSILIVWAFEPLRMQFLR